MTPTDADAPSRTALVEAEAAYAAAGHENDGFLSEAHGFLPREMPRLRLPESHAAWDELAEQLPALWRDVAVRDAVRALPELPAGELAEGDLWRASSLLSIFAHSFVRVETEPGGELPAAVQRPWDELARRLGRPKRFLSYNDLIVYNWRLRDPGAADPLRVENLDLLVPTVGNEEERVFYLTQLEIIGQCTPLLGAVVRAQEAVLRDDPDALAEELLLVVERLRHVTEVSFPKIDPNPLSATYVDPVVWATTVAPFAVPIEDDTAGPSGTAAPVFHLLDVFFGRRRFASVLGKEIVHLREWFPVRQRAFLEAVDAVSVPDYVAAGSRGLRGLFGTALDAYAGPRGYLGTHRLKVYGYLELAFKVGRAVTIGGFAGAFRQRAWKEVDEELDASRRERYPERAASPRHGTIARRERLAERVERVVLEVGDAGVPHRPGDHVRVLPENAPELVERTLAALRAGGGEPVPLTGRWRELVALRPGFEAGAPAQLELAELVRYAQLRPLRRPVAKALLAVTGSERLDALVEARLEDALELPDAVELVASEGYDPRRLWRSQLWQDEAIARVVPPEPFRTYSISSGGAGGVPQELELTVQRLEYADGDGALRRGTASTFLTTANGPMAVALEVVRAVRFALPADETRPIVMFAGGTGIAPFRSFLHARRSGPGENWLFAAARTPEELPYAAELDALVAAGRLELRTAFSRVPGGARLPEVIEAHADELWGLLGRGAVVYVCGRAGFAAAVVDGLRAVAARFGAEDGGRPFLRRLAAEGRLLQDLFTTAAAHVAPGVGGDGRFDISELVLRNDDDAGRWLAVDGAVYDVSEFLHLHPGGPAIMRESCGLDASREYRAVLHHESSEVDSLLPMYKIGMLRRLDLGSRWGIALVPGEGLSYVPLRDLFRAWARYLYLVVEMENALRNDFGYLRRPLVRGDDAAGPSALKLQLAANTHARFLEAYLDGTLGDDLRRLFALCIGLCAPAERGDRLDRELAAALASPSAVAVREGAAQTQRLYREADPSSERARAFCAAVEELDARYLRELKLQVREGILVFEELEGAAADEGGERLLASLLGVPALVRRWCDEAAAAIDA